MVSSHPKRPVLVLLALLAAALLGFLWHLGMGSTSIGVLSVAKALLGVSDDDTINRIVRLVRLPRAEACLVVGAILGMVGSAFQALFRNPLAEPYVVGVSSGAAVGGALALVSGFALQLGGFGMMAGATVGGLVSLTLVFNLARRRGVLDVQTLLLAGVVTASLLSAVLSLVLLWSGRDTNLILQWLLGSFSGVSRQGQVGIMAIALVAGGVVLVLQSKGLNAFALGEESAQRLGVDTRRLKPVVLVVSSMMVASTVGVVGIIGFLGLVAPHIARRLLGVDWRWSLIGSALMGGTLLLLADVIAQRAVPGTDVPVGIVTAILGAPFLLLLMRRTG